MSSEGPKPTPQPAKVKKKKKRKSLQANAPFWVQLNNSGKRPKRNKIK